MKMTTSAKKKPVAEKTPAKKSTAPKKGIVEKSAPKKAVKKESTVDKFVANKIGANIIVTYNKERYSRKISKEEAEVVMRKMELYNKKPTESNRKTIIDLLIPATTKKVAAKEKVEATIKGYKKLEKKESKKAKVTEKVSKDIMQELEEQIIANSDNIAKIEAVLAKFKKVIVPEKETSSNRRPGEY